MAANYTGDPAAAHAPSPAPRIGKKLIVLVPADNDPRNSATMFEQQYKTLADWATAGMQAAQRVADDLVFEDDFFGSQLDLSKWSAAPTGLTFNDGGLVVSGGLGYAHLTANSASRDLHTPSGGGLVGTLDFRLRAKIAINALTTAGSVCHLGLEDSGGILKTGFEAVKGSNGNRWYATVNGTRHDSGIAWSGSFQIIEAQRVGGHFYMYINGAPVYDEAVSVTSMVILSWLVEDLSALSDAYLDFVKLWVGRSTDGF